jgi:nucleoside-diphosphate-sugar epimerase
VVADAVARGWHVTVFNRGVTGSAPPGVERLRGDRLRRADLGVLAGRRWEVVVDTWSGAPRAVADAARILAGQVDRYVYVSSRSVYRQPLVTGMREDTPVVTADPDAEDGDYGEMKAGGELAARRYIGGDRVLIARTGLVLGPHEDVGRLPWWLARMAQGGDVVAPGPPESTVQCVDARDLAAWLLDAGEAQLTGTFNALSRPGHTTMTALLECCRRATGSRARLRWLEPEVILAAGVLPWAHLPIWVPPGHPFRPMHETNTDQAAANGLRCRPMEQTVADTWNWMGSSGRIAVDDWANPTLGLSPAMESALLRSTPD